MSLIMHMHFPGAGRAAVKALARRASEEFGIRLHLPFFGRAIELTAAHDALTDDADWNTEYWAMDSEELLKIEREVRILHQLSESDAVLTALWAGDSAAEEITLSMEEMATIIRTGRIGTHSAYRIERQVGSQGKPQ